MLDRNDTLPILNTCDIWHIYYFWFTATNRYAITWWILKYSDTLTNFENHQWNWLIFHTRTNLHGWYTVIIWLYFCNTIRLELTSTKILRLTHVPQILKLNDALSAREPFFDKIHYHKLTYSFVLIHSLSAFSFYRWYAVRKGTTLYPRYT